MLQTQTVLSHEQLATCPPRQGGLPQTRIPTNQQTIKREGGGYTSKERVVQSSHKLLVMTELSDQRLCPRNIPKANLKAIVKFHFLVARSFNSRLSNRVRVAGNQFARQILECVLLGCGQGLGGI